MKRGIDSVVAKLSSTPLPALRPVSRYFGERNYSLFEPSASEGAHLFGLSLGDTAYGCLASFYEGLVNAIFGSTHQRTRIHSEDGSSGYPDIMHIGRKYALESKALRAGRPLDLRDNQIGYLDDFLRSNPGYRLSFAVSRYRAPLVPLPEMSSSEFLEHFTSGATGYMLLLPFSVASHLFSHGEEHGVAYRFHGSRRWLPRVRVHSNVVDRLAYDPTGALEQIGLDARDYSFSLQRSSATVKFQNTKVHSFPIVRIADKSHRKWVELFTRAPPSRAVAPKPAMSSMATTESLERDILLANGQEIPF